jgi:hypothetical protein
VQHEKRYSASCFRLATLRECIQKFPDWPPGASTANGTVFCHQVQFYRYFVSLPSEFCHHNPLCCFSTSVYFCKSIFRYRLSPETFGYTLVLSFSPFKSHCIALQQTDVMWNGSVALHCSLFQYIVPFRAEISNYNPWKSIFPLNLSEICQQWRINCNIDF